MPNGGDKSWTRMCITVACFKSRFGCWPTRLGLSPSVLELFRDSLLSPDLFSSLQERMALVPEESFDPEDFLAEDAAGHQCTKEEAFGSHAHETVDVEAWIGGRPPSDGF